MIQVFLSYARADGQTAASRLRGELEAMGFAVWRDVEEMQGGLAWKEQLRAALRQVDVTLVLLTPGATASKTVEWEWENALTLGKRVIGLLIQPCDVPAELKRLHYHDLSNPATYTLGLARLARDLLRVAVNKQFSAESAMTAAKYQNITTIGDSIVGEGNVLVKQTGSGGLDGDAIARLVTALRSLAPGNPAVQAEIAALLREMRPKLDEVAAGVRDLQAGQARILARFDESEQRILAPILARLDQQHAALTDAILDALETRAFPADELGRHLATIHMALAEINARSAQIADRQLAEAAQKLAEVAGDPRLGVKHKLKVMIPILPVLAYEGEIDLSSSAKLREVWEALRAWIKDR